MPNYEKYLADPDHPTGMNLDEMPEGLAALAQANLLNQLDEQRAVLYGIHMNLDHIYKQDSWLMLGDDITFFFPENTYEDGSMEGIESPSLDRIKLLTLNLDSCKGKEMVEVISELYLDRDNYHESRFGGDDSVESMEVSSGS